MTVHGTAERRERVMEALGRAGRGGVSGEALAGDLGCSRAAVHRHVEALRREGVAIVSAHDGYRLGDDEAVLAAIETGQLSRYVCDFPSARLHRRAGVIALPFLVVVAVAMMWWFTPSES